LSGLFFLAGKRDRYRTVVPAKARIQGMVQNVLSWTSACAVAAKNFGLSGCANQPTAGLFFLRVRAANTVVPAKAGIQGPVQNVLSWTPAYAGAMKDCGLSGCAN